MQGLAAAKRRRDRLVGEALEALDGAEFGAEADVLRAAARFVGEAGTRAS